MSNINKVILLGRLGRDPDVRYLDNQRVVAGFSLATSEYYKDRNGNRMEQTEWHDVEMWDDLARLVEKYLKKGNMVYIEGKIRTNHWKDKDGNERSAKRIRGTSVTLWSNNSGGGGQHNQQHPDSHRDGNQGENERSAPQPVEEAAAVNNTVEDPADDLPF